MQAKEQSNLIVLTGGPGVGKTSLLRELEARGYGCADEVAREIIRDQIGSQGDALPWANKESYARLMLGRSIEQWLALQSAKSLVFVDRGLPDTLCYAGLAHLSHSFRQEALRACEEFRYCRTVFLAPAWEEIYVTDQERRQNFKEAVATEELMRQTYRTCGYELMELPKVSVSERADFVLQAIAAAR